MTKRLPTITKIENALHRYNTGPGITLDSLSKVARVPRGSITQRVAELREHYKIYTNYRKVNGKRTAFYRLAGELN